MAEWNMNIIKKLNESFITGIPVSVQVILGFLIIGLSIVPALLVDAIK